MIQRLTLATLLALLPFANTWSQESDDEEQPWYQVEVLVFSQADQPLSAEYWNPERVPQLNPDAQQLLPTINDTLAAEQQPPLPGSTTLRLLPDQQRQLPVNTASMRRKGYQILFHHTWQQQLQSKQQARPIRISGGDLLNESLHSLEGDITLDISRYLHLRTNLYYSVRLPDNWEAPFAIKNPALSADTPAQTTEPLITDIQIAEDSSPPITPLSTDQTPLKDPSILTIALQQNRRMRGGEVHYIDHPLLGVLIRLNPIEPPAIEAVTAAPAIDTSATTTGLITIDTAITTAPVSTEPPATGQ